MLHISAISFCEGGIQPEQLYTQEECMLLDIEKFSCRIFAVSLAHCAHTISTSLGAHSQHTHLALPWRPLTPLAAKRPTELSARQPLITFMDMALHAHALIACPKQFSRWCRRLAYSKACTRDTKEKGSLQQRVVKPQGKPDAKRPTSSSRGATLAIGTAQIADDSPSCPRGTSEAAVTQLERKNRTH